MDKNYNVIGYVKLAKLWERSENSAIEYHHNYYQNKFANYSNYNLHDVYIDITGKKETYKRMEMVRLLKDCQFGYGVYFMNQKTPSLTVTYKTIKFNKAMHDRLDCKYIEILYHPILKMIAIKETTEDNPYALCWKNEDGSMKTSLNSKAFSKSIYDRIGWKEDYSFKFRGITRIRGNAKLMIFYLDEPQIIPSKKAIKEHHSVDTDASAQYVEYKESTENAEPQPPRKMLVSETWASQEMFGISLALRKKRDWIVNFVLTVNLF